MSGLVGHTLYAILAAKSAEARSLRIAGTLRRNFPNYLCGAYLGCDIQVMPEAVCVDTGREVGFGTAPLEKSPLTGGKVAPWFLEHDGARYRPREIHELFYGRSHLVFGWAGDDARFSVPWDHLHDYCALVVRDSMHSPGSSDRSLAYLFGWMVHIVGDSLIKSIRPGIKMHLLDGTYTPRNRPIQDLFAFHEIGIKELQLGWQDVFKAMAATPIEAIQPHYMRIARPDGELGGMFAEGWKPERADLLQAVLRENRRWLKHHAQDVLQDMTLTQGENGPQVSAKVKAATGGLDYAPMMAMAQRSDLRGTLQVIADTAADLFGKVVTQVPALK